MSVADVGDIVALLAMLAMHFFRGPNRQADDIRGELETVRENHNELRREHNALSHRLSGEHYTRNEIKDMLRDLRVQIDTLQVMMGEIRTAVALLGAKNGIRSGH